MEDPDAHIAPCCELCVFVRVANERKGKRHGVEDCRLLVEMIIVFRDSIDRFWDLGSHVVVEVLVFKANVVLANGANSCRMHPALHNESPTGQSCQWLQQRSASQLQCHCCVFILREESPTILLYRAEAIVLLFCMLREVSCTV